MSLQVVQWGGARSSFPYKAALAAAPPPALILRLGVARRQECGPCDLLGLPATLPLFYSLEPRVLYTLSHSLGVCILMYATMQPLNCSFCHIGWLILGLLRLPPWKPSIPCQLMYSKLFS